MYDRKYTSVRDKNGKTVRENDIILVKFYMLFDTGERLISRYVKITWDGSYEKFIIRLPNSITIEFGEKFSEHFDIEIVGNALDKYSATFRLLDIVYGRNKIYDYH